MRTPPPKPTDTFSPREFELPPDRSPRWFRFAAVVLVVIAATAFFWWKLASREKLVASAIPQIPASTLAAYPEILRARIADAEQHARDSHGRAATDALAELARLYHANGLFTQAAQIYPVLAAIDPKEPRWPFLQATILANFGRLDEALPLLQTARKLAPERIAPRLQLAELFFKTNQTPQAIALYRNVLTDAPDDIYAHLGLARIDIAAQSWTTARTHLRAVTGLHADYAEPWNLLATVYEKLNQPADAQAARDHAKKARALPAPPDDWIDPLVNDCYDAYQVRIAADIARSTGDIARARALFDHALSFAPDDAATHRQLGKMLPDLGPDYNAEAYKHLRRATILAPSHADGWAWLIAHDNATGDTTTALNESALALANCPQSGGIRYEYARALKAAGNLPAALHQFQETRRLRPEETAGVSMEIALIYFRQNKLDEGAAELRATLEADPGHPVALTTMTRLAIGKNAALEASQWLSRATAEPRVSRADIAQLNALYRKQFPQGAPGTSPAPSLRK